MVFYRYTGLTEWTWFLFYFILQIRQFMSSSGNLSNSSSNAVFRHCMFSDEIATCICPSQSIPDILYRVEVWKPTRPMQKLSSLSRNSSTRRAICGLMLLSIKMNSGQQGPWKGEHRTPKSHPYNSRQSQCHFRKHKTGLLLKQESEIPWPF